VAQIACSSEPPPGKGQPTFTPAGTSAGGNASVFPTAGTGGTFETAGTGFGTAGTDVGGTSTGGTGETAGTGTAGTPPIVVVPPYCEDKTPAPLPFEVTTAFYESAWQGDFTQISVPADLAMNACDDANRPADHVGGCSKWRYTPAATGATWAAVAWVNRADDKFTHEPVCLAEGAKGISFYARGVKGGEIISVGGAGALEVAFTLTADWKKYYLPLDGVDYNNAKQGLPSGFSWKVDPAEPAELTPITEFFIDSIQVVSTDAPVDSGEGGAGAGGDSGAGGAG
jgi:hypothetical protein